MRRCDENNKQSTINSCRTFGRFGSSAYFGNTFFFLWCVSLAAFTASTNAGSERASLMWLLSKEGLTAPMAASTNAQSARASTMWLLSKKGLVAPAARGQSMGGDNEQRAQGEKKGEKGGDELPPVSAILLIAKEAGS